ncbi:hypothetical protein FDB24_02080 [Clostridium botulinum]|uniref:hypothetical protein n=1 Tax=Clostridium botulinum TaxID=1491 RepID=UPI000774CBD5|nr:hypothetical protein [Clostridium botulinum]NFL85842.1 hypothetical protein [Clostridium botulinum]NFO20083.1 hypothetical protein [Clostridium botulinum]
MSQLITRMTMQDEFEYRILFGDFNEEEVKHYQEWIYSRFHSICNKKMNSKLNSEWIVRHYLATKMILSATVMLSSLNYCIENNVKMSVPYLSYYSILTCCRAVIFTLPDVKWNNKSFLEMTHSKICNEIKNCFMKLNKDCAEEIFNDINMYRNYREMFSYRFPASGIDIVSEGKYAYRKTVELCTILCELAQLNSKEIEKYIIKNCLEDIEEWKELDMDYLKHCFCYELDNKIDVAIDDDDWYRIDYIRRKQPFPVSIYYTMSEGMVDDFFCAWCCSDNEDDDTLYNPDVNYRIIFPVP